MAGIQQRHHQQRTIAPVSKTRLQGVDQGIKFVEMPFGLRFPVKEMRHLANRIFRYGQRFFTVAESESTPGRNARHHLF